MFGACVGFRNERLFGICLELLKTGRMLALGPAEARSKVHSHELMVASLKDQADTETQAWGRAAGGQVQMMALSCPFGWSGFQKGESRSLCQDQTSKATLKSKKLALKASLEAGVPLAGVFSTVVREELKERLLLSIHFRSSGLGLQASQLRLRTRKPGNPSVELLALLPCGPAAGREEHSRLLEGLLIDCWSAGLGRSSD